MNLPHPNRLFPLQLFQGGVYDLEGVFDLGQQHILQRPGPTGCSPVLQAQTFQISGQDREPGRAWRWTAG